MTFVGSFVVFEGLNSDAGLAGSGTLVFPKEKDNPFGVVVLETVNDCDVGCVVANPPIRPNNDPPLTEL